MKPKKLTKTSVVNELTEEFKEFKIPRYLMKQIVAACANKVAEALNSNQIVVFPGMVTLRPTTRIVKVSTPEGTLLEEVSRSVDVRVEREFANFLTKGYRNGGDDNQTSANQP